MRPHHGGTGQVAAADHARVVGGCCTHPPNATKRPVTGKDPTRNGSVTRSARGYGVTCMCRITFGPKLKLPRFGARLTRTTYVPVWSAGNVACTCSKAPFR